MSGEIYIRRKYKGVVIKSQKCPCPNYSTEFFSNKGYVYLMGIRKLKTIKKMIDLIIEDQGLRKDKSGN